jgi:hypothetical protein
MGWAKEVGPRVLRQTANINRDIDVFIDKNILNLCQIDNASTCDIMI